MIFHNSLRQRAAREPLEDSDITSRNVARRRPRLADVQGVVPLRDAVERYRQEERAAGNSYGWYQREAASDGEIWIGGTKIPAAKVRGVWTVVQEDLDRAIAAHREYVAAVHEATDDYRRRILRGTDGERVETTWGYYQPRGNFHFRFSRYDSVRRKSDGSWHCSRCWRAADCRDGVATCPECAASMRVGWC